MLLTVCLITYKHQRYIKKAFSSILSQKVNFNLEISVADDVLTNKTHQIIKKYEE